LLNYCYLVRVRLCLATRVGKFMCPTPAYKTPEKGLELRGDGNLLVLF